MLIMTSNTAETAVDAAATVPPTTTSSTDTSSTPTAVAALDSQELLARKQFPAVVFLLQHRSGGLDSSDMLSTLGVYMSLSNANAECRRLKREAIPPPADEAPDQASKRLDEERRKDIRRELERWSDAGGVECWVEAYAVIPRKSVVGRGSVSSVTHPGKLYQNEDDDDEIVDDDDYEGYHC